MLFFLILPALWYDIRTFRIPNRLIVVGSILGAMYRLLYPGKFSIVYYLLSMAGMFLLLIPFFKWKVIGGGDVKLLSVCALMKGFQSACSISLYALFIGGIFSLFYLVYHRIIPTQKTIERHVIHFSIPVFLGAAVEQIWGGMLWQI